MGIGVNSINCALCIISICLVNECFSTSRSIKISSYNTYHSSAATPRAKAIKMERQTKQIQEIIDSDIDLICLQELPSISDALIFKKGLTETYPYSFSELDLVNFTSTTSCSSSQNILINNCIVPQCSSYYPNPIELLKCINQNCQNDGFQIYYTHCIYCIAYYPQLTSDPTPSFTEAIDFCTVIEFTVPIDILDGTALYSKYPIINQWHIDIPSEALEKQAVNIAEIDVFGNKLIACCIHLTHTNENSFNDVYLPGDKQQVYDNITNLVDLNKYQSLYIIDILNQFIVDNRQLLAVLGDFNIGRALHPTNLELWIGSGFIPSNYLVQKMNSIDDFCTFCSDPNGNDLPNILATDFCKIHQCPLADTDLDHILVYSKKRKVQLIKAIEYQRVFTDLYDIGTETNVPLSDHWGVLFEFEFKRKGRVDRAIDNVLYHNEALSTNYILFMLLVANAMLIFSGFFLCYHIHQKQHK